MHNSRESKIFVKFFGTKKLIKNLNRRFIKQRYLFLNLKYQIYRTYPLRLRPNYNPFAMMNKSKNKHYRVMWIHHNCCNYTFITFQCVLLHTCNAISCFFSVLCVKLCFLSFLIVFIYCLDMSGFRYYRFWSDSNLEVAYVSKASNLSSLKVREIIFCNLDYLIIDFSGKN